jgi:GDP-4-dehydro-6-deoxy-D-mannose reductase
MRILVTGITGFAGGHLAERLLVKEGNEVYGTGRQGEWPTVWRHLASKVILIACDLCEASQLENLLNRTQPDQIYHLAGYAHAGQSSREPDAAWEGNLTATRRLYEGLAQSERRARVLAVGSGLIYGEPDSAEKSFDELAPLRPATPYASSKAAADLLAIQFGHTPGVDIVRVRPFNHIGPGQSPQYAVPHFAQQIAAIEQGRQAPKLECGNLSARRDLTDVRDMVRAYELLMECGRAGEVYNAGSGEVYTIQTVLDRLLGMARVPIEVCRQPALLRAADASVIRADAAKLRRETGWKPEFTLDQTLADTLAYWRSRYLEA